VYAKGRQRKPQEKTITRNLTKKIKKKTFTKKEGARPNPRLAAAAPSPQFFPLFFPNLRNHSFTPTFKRIPFDLSLLNQPFPPHDQPTQQGSVE